MQKTAKVETAQGAKIRIKVRAYDHKLIDQSVKQIGDTK
jgi:ribosomal protein S10